MKPESCGTCRFFLLRNNATGDCRRYPPQYTGNMIAWPNLGANEWCGEYQCRPAKKQPPTKK